jgi:hypothetical protein
MTLEKHPGSEFLMAVPFTVGFAKGLAGREREGIDRVTNSIETSSSPHRGVMRKVALYGTEISAYVLYNPERQAASRNDPAVYEVLPARIRALRSIVPKVRNQGRQTVPEQWRENVRRQSWRAQQNDLGKPEPEPPNGRRSIYSPVMRRKTCYNIYCIFS